MMNGQHTGQDDDMPSPKSITRNFQQVGTAPLISWIKREDLTHDKAGEMLGYSGSAVSGWIREGRMPKVVTLGIEAFDRRRRAEPDKILMVRESADKIGGLITVLKAMGIPFTTL